MKRGQQDQMNVVINCLEGYTFDAGKCSQLHESLFETSLDWHEYAYYLDTLASKGFLKRVSSPKSFTQYELIDRMSIGAVSRLRW